MITAQIRIVANTPTAAPAPMAIVFTGSVFFCIAANKDKKVREQNSAPTYVFTYSNADTIMQKEQNLDSLAWYLSTYVKKICTLMEIHANVDIVMQKAHT